MTKPIKKRKTFIGWNINWIYFKHKSYFSLIFCNLFESGYCSIQIIVPIIIKKPENSSFLKDKFSFKNK